MNFDDKKVLKLTLKSKWFWMMMNGIKKREFRRDSKWIESRLINKKGDFIKYDFVQFTNGYGNDKPVFWIEFENVEIAPFDDVEEFRDNDGNVLTLKFNAGNYIINLGLIAHHKNCFPKFF